MQSRDAAAAKQIIDDAKALEKAEEYSFKMPDEALEQLKQMLK